MWQAKKNHNNIKIDYQRRRLANPFFHHEKKQRKRQSWFFWLFLVISMICFVIWFIFCSPVWLITDIEIKGINRTNQESIEKIIREESEKKRYLFFKQTNIWLFDVSASATRIINEFNLIDLQISKKIPGTLLLNASERPYSFIFQEGSDYFYASADAYVIKEPKISDSDWSKYFILENKNNSLIGEKYKINLTDNYLKFIFELSNSINGASLAVERYIIDQELNTLKVKFVSGPIALFNVRDAANNQVERLTLLLAKKPKMKDNFNMINYIDLRYGDRIFVNPETLIN